MIILNLFNIFQLDSLDNSEKIMMSFYDVINNTEKKWFHRFRTYLHSFVSLFFLPSTVAQAINASTDTACLKDQEKGTPSTILTKKKFCLFLSINNHDITLDKLLTYKYLLCESVNGITCICNHHKRSFVTGSAKRKREMT